MILIQFKEILNLIVPITKPSLNFRLKYSILTTILNYKV